MSKIVFHFLLITNLCVAQQTILPKINFTQNSITANPYIGLLKLTDNNALIVRSYNSEFAVSYLVLSSDGAMHRYGLYNIDGKNLIRKLNVTENEKARFLKLISDINTLDATQLNLKEVTLSNGTKSEVNFNNYPDYFIEMYQGIKSVTFNSLQADGFIEAEVSGYRMRQKLVSIFKDLDFSETIATHAYDAVKAKDTVYIRFKKSNFEQKQTIAGGDKLYDIAFGGKNHAYLLTKNNSPAFVADTAFLEKHQSETVDYDFFLKYNTRISFFHFRVLYIIDETDASGKKIVVPVSDFSVI
ncbi:hypothetical protein GR160_14505 [Flavobacterium sp. Sd200]|uniref:hypothetical protein n=1 Tax=Flavobacterium sp. Sd200 TaxID=2692211 RepID=UPI0013700D18|nr:hypothetical protein [Flavobacterium sp. Sd200]MXN92437.1 hypothetical protein [Flavobacterium sp. Sd200]